MAITIVSFRTSIESGEDVRQTQLTGTGFPVERLQAL